MDPSDTPGILCKLRGCPLWKTEDHILGLTLNPIRRTGRSIPFLCPLLRTAVFPFSGNVPSLLRRIAPGLDEGIQSGLHRIKHNKVIYPVAGSSKPTESTTQAPRFIHTISCEP